jgi:hypothetical protein
VDDFIRDMTHGFVIRSGWADPEPGLTAGVCEAGSVLEVERGKIVARTGISLQFATKALLTSKLLALGDDTTVRSDIISTVKGVPWQQVTYPATAPAAFCKDVEVFAWKYTALAS